MRRGARQSCARSSREQAHTVNFAFSKQYQNGSEAERRLHQKGHHCSRLQQGLARQRIEVDEMEVEDANPPWNARERAIIKNMESCLENTEKVQVGIEELEYYMLDIEKRSVSLPSPRPRQTTEDTAGSCCSTRAESKNWRMLRAFSKQQGRRGVQEARRHHGDG